MVGKSYGPIKKDSESKLEESSPLQDFEGPNPEDSVIVESITQESEKEEIQTESDSSSPPRDLGRKITDQQESLSPLDEVLKELSFDDKFLKTYIENYHQKYLNSDFQLDNFISMIPKGDIQQKQQIFEKLKEDQQKDELSKTELEERLDSIIETHFKEKNVSKKLTRKEILPSMRLLLQQYPIPINFKSFETFEELADNLSQVHALLLYCYMKSNDVNLREAITEELYFLNTKTHIRHVRQLLMQVKSDELEWGATEVKEKLNELLLSNIDVIIDYVTYFSLVIPEKGKKLMHMSTLHGVPASQGDEFFSDVMSESEGVEPGQSFTINPEGKIELT